MFIHFFERVALPPLGERELAGRLHFRRLAAPQRALALDFWRSCSAPLTKVQICSNGCIEDNHSDVQVDFANKVIGGGVICGGCVQEEIRLALLGDVRMQPARPRSPHEAPFTPSSFAICPLLTTSLVCCPVMEPHEAMTLTGAEQYSKYNG